jgi:hypothetical protein
MEYYRRGPRGLWEMSASGGGRGRGRAGARKADSGMLCAGRESGDLRAWLARGAESTLGEMAEGAKERWRAA